MPLENLEVSERMGVILSIRTLHQCSSFLRHSLALCLPCSVLERVLELENLALRHQIGVPQRSARKRFKSTSAGRLLWVWLSRIWSDLRSALAIVKPEMVVA